MSYLLDTNVLLRWARPSDLHHTVARAAIAALVEQGEALFITAQNVMEFWHVATRPVDRNGYGMSPAEAAAEIRQLEDLFPFLPDVPAVYEQWRSLAISTGVAGVRVYDARLVAVMLVHAVTHVLTFNSTDFRHFNITVVDPRDLPPPSAPLAQTPHA